MTISVVITNYNSWDIALNCIEAHLKYAGNTIEKVLLVDDCSTEKYEGPLDPRVEVIRNKKNLGFVKSVNVGFRHADTDIVVLFDADAAPLMDYSSIIKDEFIQNPSLGVIGFTTLDKNNRISGSSEIEPGVLSLILGQKMYHLYQKYFSASSDNIVVYSCTMAVRKKAFESVGGFDENFDWLDPDNDFCMSVRKKGWRIRYSDRIKAFHEGGGTPQIVSQRVLRFYKNRWYLLRKHGKIKKVGWIRMIILSRLRLEYLYLRFFGRLMFREPEVYEDKLTGRNKIIDFCKENYR
jgi:GT2 family glycosyltransferase